MWHSETEETDMTESAVVSTDISDSNDAGRVLGLKIAEAIQGPPDVVILFAASTYEYTLLLESLKKTCRTALLIGCSSAGEFTHATYGEGMASALALRSSDMKFSLSVGRDLNQNSKGAAEAVVSSFQGTKDITYRHRAAIVLADALAGVTDYLVEQLTLLTDGSYQFFGGGAGDNALFSHTPVFYNTEVINNGVVALEILSQKPLGIGMQHGWRPASERMQVTKIDGMCLMRLDDKPAVQAFQEHALATGQTFHLDDPLPFFLHNVIGIDIGGGHKLRVPLSVDTDGSILCAAEIPPQSIIQIMSTTHSSAAKAAASATNLAMQRLYGSKPAVALFFDCVATRLRIGKEFGFELDTVKKTLATTPYVGCNSHGQIVRTEGQFSGFHNCTAVVCIIPE